MSFIDLILIAILTWFTIVGCEKGLIRSLAGFVGYLAASVAAAVIGRMAAGALYQNFIYDNLAEHGGPGSRAKGTGSSGFAAGFSSHRPFRRRLFVGA